MSATREQIGGFWCVNSSFGTDPSLVSTLPPTLVHWTSFAIMVRHMEVQWDQMLREDSGQGVANLQAPSSTNGSCRSKGRNIFASRHILVI